MPLNKILSQFLFDSLFQCPETTENAKAFIVHIQSLCSNSVCSLEKGFDHWMIEIVPSLSSRNYLKDVADGGIEKLTYETKSCHHFVTS